MASYGLIIFGFPDLAIRRGWLIGEHRPRMHVPGRWSERAILSSYREEFQSFFREFQTSFRPSQTRRAQLDLCIEASRPSQIRDGEVDPVIKEASIGPG
jgi:hypothetical protein